MKSRSSLIEAAGQRVCDEFFKDGTTPRDGLVNYLRNFELLSKGFHSCLALHISCVLDGSGEG
jgi:hypothetical protein